MILFLWSVIGTKDFNFDEWKDNSPEKNVLDYLKLIKLTRLEIDKKFEFTPIA